MKENAEKDLKKLEFDIVVEDDEIKDLNNKEALHLIDTPADNNNDNIGDIGVINEHDDQHNHFCVPDDNLQQQNHHFGKRKQQDSDAANKDDDNNGHFYMIGGDGSSADGLSPT